MSSIILTINFLSISEKSKNIKYLTHFFQIFVHSLIFCAKWHVDERLSSLYEENKSHSKKDTLLTNGQIGLVNILEHDGTTSNRENNEFLDKFLVQISIEWIIWISSRDNH